MKAYIIRRLFFASVLVLLSTVIAFTILKLSPGQPGREDFDPRLSKEYIEAQRRIFGLDRSPVAQYFSWLGVMRLIDSSEAPGLLQGDMGLSIKYKQPVGEVIQSRLGATLALSISTLIFTWMVALPLGIWAAMRHYQWPDKVLSFVSFTGMSTPSFFMALLLLWLFASRVQWLPPGGLRSLDHESMSWPMQMWDYARHLFVPVLVLTFGALAGLQRIMRGNMLEVLRAQYVTTARAKGLNENKVIYKHALRNAVNPLVTILGFEFAGLFGGAALLENVINFPGMGQLILEALKSKDQALVMSSFLIGSIMLVMGNLLADLLLVWVDPRVSYD
ncbi:MAG TPA: ABC transporter permease [Tepidisphaeraceae bacterium]|jgi:peptide/nickel transport system permease protein